MLAGGAEDKEHAMSQKLDTSPAIIGIDVGNIVDQNQGGAIVLRHLRRRAPPQSYAKGTWS